MVAGENSAETTRLFSARGLQGGGVTWAALLRRFAERHGRQARELSEQPPGVTVTGALYSYPFYEPRRDLTARPCYF